MRKFSWTFFLTGYVYNDKLFSPRRGTMKEDIDFYNFWTTVKFVFYIFVIGVGICLAIDFISYILGIPTCEESFII